MNFDIQQQTVSLGVGERITLDCPGQAFAIDTIEWARLTTLSPARALVNFDSHPQISIGAGFAFRRGSFRKITIEAPLPDVLDPDTIPIDQMLVLTFFYSVNGEAEFFFFG